MPAFQRRFGNRRRVDPHAQTPRRADDPGPDHGRRRAHHGDDDRARRESLHRAESSQPRRQRLPGRAHAVRRARFHRHHQSASQQEHPGGRHESGGGDLPSLPASRRTGLGHHEPALQRQGIAGHQHYWADPQHGRDRHAHRSLRPFLQRVRGPALRAGDHHRR